jgi:hypothetical protein
VKKALEDFTGADLLDGCAFGLENPAAMRGHTSMLTASSKGLALR